MADVQDILAFRKLCKHKDIEAKLINTYVDDDYFFDYIGEGEGVTLTFCEINERNKDRYNLLCNINDTISTPAFERSRVDVFEYNDKQWFLEIIPKHSTNYLETPLESIDKLFEAVDEVNSCITTTLHRSSIKSNNLLYVDYFRDEIVPTYHGTPYLAEHIDRISGDELYATLGDLEKTLEMSRVRYDGGYKFCGLQSLLPLPSIHGKINAVIFASMGSPDIVRKLKDVDSVIVKRIIQTVRRQAIERPDFYTYDASRLIEHLDWIETHYG